MNRFGIAVLIGLPGAGKSTLAQQLISCDASTKCQSTESEITQFLQNDRGHDKLEAGLCKQQNHLPKCKTMQSDSGDSENAYDHNINNAHSLVFHRISYDKIMPNEIKLLSKDDEITSGQKNESDWKIHRQEILKCFEKHLLMKRRGKALSGVPCEKSDATENALVDPIIWTKFKTELMRGKEEGPLENVVYIIDDNMYYRSMRYEYYRLARKYKIGFSQIFLESTVDDCLRRNRQRASRIPEDVIFKMANNIQPPDKANHWEENSLTIVTDECMGKMADVLSLIKHSIENPVEPIQEPDEEVRRASQIICSTNVIHRADKILRRLVSSWIVRAKESGRDKLELGRVARESNELKNQILLDMRSGSLRIHPECDSPTGEENKLENFLTSLFTHLHCS